MAAATPPSSPRRRGGRGIEEEIFPPGALCNELAVDGRLLAAMRSRAGCTHLLHPARPANTPRLCFGRAYAVAASRVTGCHIAGILSRSLRQYMRARRPRSRVRRHFPSLLPLEATGVSMGIENGSVLGTESGSGRALYRGGSAATGAGCHPGARASRPHGTWHDGTNPAKGSSAPLQGNGRGWEVACSDEVAGGMHPSPPPGPTGKHATALLRPSLRRCRQQGDRLPHRRHTQPIATAVHAGETPALPGEASLSIALAPRGDRCVHGHRKWQRFGHRKWQRASAVPRRERSDRSGMPTRERGRLARMGRGMMEPTLQREARRPLQGNGRG